MENLGGTKILWTFKSWITNFKDVDLPIGDLATDVLRDPEFPDSESFPKLLSYIESKQRIRAVSETFKIVWAFYQASR